MGRVLRRLAQGVSVLWGSATLVFLIFSQVPDPARAIAGQNERQEAMDAFRRVHGLDLPLGQRYLRFLGELSPWGPHDAGWGLKAPSLGVSYFGERPVVDALMEVLPATLLLALTAMGLALLLGVSLGLDVGLARRWTCGAGGHWIGHLGHECAVVFCGHSRGVALRRGVA